MPSKARTRLCSTPNAMAKGKNFSNIWGVLITRWKRSDSIRVRNSSKPSTCSSTCVPRLVRAGMNHPNLTVMRPDARLPQAQSGWRFHSFPQGLRFCTPTWWVGSPHSIDADLSKHYDSIPHAKLMAVVAERIIEGILHLSINLVGRPCAYATDSGCTVLDGSCCAMPSAVRRAQLRREPSPFFDRVTLIKTNDPAM